jgi:Fe(3+) dicitrate transport protein
LNSPDNFDPEYLIIAGANSADDALSVKANNREYYSRGIQSIIGSTFETSSLNHELEVGLRYHEDGMDRFQWVDGYGMQDGTMILTSVGTRGTESNRIESAFATALFIQDNITFAKWKFTPGLRFENIILKRDDFGRNDPERTESDLTSKRNALSVLIPGIGFNYELNTSTNLFGGVHRGFAPPSPGASEGTEEESSINYEFGVRFENEDAQKVELVTFYNDYSNLLGTDLAAGGGGGSTDQFNAGEVQVFGVELGLGANMTSADSDLQIPIHVNYTFTSAEFQNSFESGYDPWGTVAEGDQMPYLPKHQFNVGLDAIYKNLSVNFSGTGTSKMRTIAGSEDIDLVPNTDSYFLIDISASYQITSTTQFVFDVRNLTDRTYLVSRRPAGLRPGLPRMIQAGIKLTF